MAKLSAFRIMMSSQLGNENTVGATRDDSYASCANSIADVHRGLLYWIRGARLAVAQASCATEDLRALYCRIARHHVRAYAPRILICRRPPRRGAMGWRVRAG